MTTATGWSIPIEDELTDAELSSARELAAEVEEPFGAIRQPSWLLTDGESPQYLAAGRAMADELVQRGWYTMHLPAGLGGEGDFLRYAVLRELEGYYRVPPHGGHARFVVAPALARFATGEQRAQYLPRIASGELIICEGFTEPEAGSDVGSMKTSAVLDGDEYVVNGTKIFVTYGPYANMMILAAITDAQAPKHRNMSLFLIDMDLPGMSKSPLVCLTGHEISQIHFDNVRIPKEALLGTPNAGFSHLTAVLNFERSGVNRVARYMAHLEDFLTEAKPAGLWADSSVRESVGALTAQIEAWRDVCWRVVALQRKGDVPTWEAFMAELYRKEINPKFGRLIFELFGREATIEERGEPVLLGGRPEWLLREGFNNHGQGARFDTLNTIARRELALTAR